MTYLKRVTTLITAACLGGAMVASAETVAEKFASMDTDANGLVSLAEFVVYATSSGQHTTLEAQDKFAELAGDDGALSYEELEAAHAGTSPEVEHTDPAGS